METQAQTRLQQLESYLRRAVVIASYLPGQEMRTQEVLRVCCVFDQLTHMMKAFMEGSHVVFDPLGALHSTEEATDPAEDHNQEETTS